MVAAIVLLAACVGTVVGSNQADQTIGHVFRHGEGEGALGFAHLVGGCFAIVIEVITAIVFGFLHIDRHEHVGGVGGQRLIVAHEFKGTGEYVIAVGATGDLLVGSVRDAEQFELNPQVILGTQVHIVHNVSQVVNHKRIRYMIGLFIFVHKRGDEAPEFRSVDVLVLERVSFAAFWHQCQVDIADAVVIVAQRTDRDVHLSARAEEIHLLISQANSIQ